MAIVANMQPNFFPWQGLFELILKSDKFILLDDFQYVERSHNRRNRLFIHKNNIGYYNVEMKKSMSHEKPLNKAVISSDSFWKKKLLKKLHFNYYKTPYFDYIFPIISDLINTDIYILSEFNINIIKKFCSLMELNPIFLYSSDFTNETKSIKKRASRIEELLDWAGATQYISAFGSYNYMEEDNFNFKKYNTIFQNYQPKPYTQIQSCSFVPYLSILDAFFNIGPIKTLELIKNGTEKFLSREERKLMK